MLEKVSHAMQRPSAYVGVSDPSLKQGDRILVADDDAMTRELLTSVLEDQGFQVFLAEDGEEAWGILQKESIQIVVTDWRMPRLDGLQLMQRIRSRLAAQMIYVIILTGRGIDRDLVEALDTGADDFLSKPFDLEELRVRIQAGRRIVRMQQQLLIQNWQLDQDLSAATRLQEALLPATLPSLNGFHLDWRFRPCTHLSGDMLNVFRLDENRIGFFVLDVSGHGAAAAMLAVTVSRLLIPVSGQTTLVKGTLSKPPYYYVDDPATVVAALRQHLLDGVCTHLFFTMIYCILDTSTGEVAWASAGHEPPLHARKDSLSVLDQEPTGALLGPDLPFTDPKEPNRVVLAPGERLWLYSDGIVEAKSLDDEMYTADRLVRSVRDVQDRPLGESLDQVLERAADFTGAAFQDDVTLLVVERLDPDLAPVPAPRREPSAKS